MYFSFCCTTHNNITQHNTHFNTITHNTQHYTAIWDTIKCVDWPEKPGDRNMIYRWQSCGCWVWWHSFIWWPWQFWMVCNHGQIFLPFPDFPWHFKHRKTVLWHIGPDPLPHWASLWPYPWWYGSKAWYNPDCNMPWHSMVYYCPFWLKQMPMAICIKVLSLSGILLILIATFIPFEHLNDTISCAVLLALSLTDSSLILLWHKDKPPLSYGHDGNVDHMNSSKHHTTAAAAVEELYVAQYLMLAFHVACCIASALLTHGSHVMGSTFGFYTSSTLSMFVVMAIPYWITVQCPHSTMFGVRQHHHPHYHPVAAQLDDDSDNGIRGNNNERDVSDYFQTPFIPYWPHLGTFINWYLMMQMNIHGMAGLLLVLAVLSLYYFVSHYSFSCTPLSSSSCIKTS